MVGCACNSRAVNPAAAKPSARMTRCFFVFIRFAFRSSCGTDSRTADEWNCDPGTVQRNPKKAAAEKCRNSLFKGERDGRFFADAIRRVNGKVKSIPGC